MKRKIILLFLLIFFVVLTFSLSTAFAQYEPHTQIGLPESAKARFGTGSFWRIKYAPNGTGTQFFVFSSMGIWLYDVETWQVDLRSRQHPTIAEDHLDGFKNGQIPTIRAVF